jgi:hypothetical protein
MVATVVVMRGLGYSNLPDLRKDSRMRYLPEFVTETIWGADNPMLQRWVPQNFMACRKQHPVIWSLYAHAEIGRGSNSGRD